MAAMDRLGVTVVLLVACQMISSVIGISYVVTAPNTIRFGVPETIAISVNDYPKPVQVQVYLEDYPGRKLTISPFNVAVNPGTPVIKTVTLLPNNIPELQRDTKNLKVVLNVVAPNGEFPKKEMILPVTKYSGFVFIQTDKPIYLPSQNVYIRVFTMNEKLMPSREPFTLEVKNPKDIRVMFEDHMPEETGITEKKLKFSSSPIFGNWTITVHFGYKHAAKTSVQFEVKEYVLPTFSVKITPPKVILSSQKVIQGNITANYVYGKPVRGILKLRHEIHTANGAKILAGTEKLKIFGTYNYKIYKDDLIFAKVPWFPQIENAVLVTQAEVLEEATGNKESAVDDTTVFTTSPYEISFPRTLTDFKPGLHYQLQIDVDLVSGQPVSTRIPLTIVSANSVRNGKKFPLHKPTTQVVTQNGRATFRFDTDRNDKSLEFVVRTNDEGVDIENQAEGTITIQQYSSPTGNTYIWISAPPDKLKFSVGDVFRTSVVVNPIFPNARLYYTVISGGFVVLQKDRRSDGGAVMQSIEFPITSEMSPNARIIVYTIKDNKVISDSIVITVERTCRYNDGKDFKVEANSPSGLFHPGRNLNLRIHGEPNSHVAITAVDEAVYLLNDRHILSSDKFFKEMEKHDLGCGPGGGSNTESVFKNAGVVLVSNAVIQDHSRSENGCQNKQRAKRSLNENVNDTMAQEMKQILAQFDEEANLCCQIGLMDGYHNKTCLERTEYIYNSIGEKYNCSQAFLECCELNVKYAAAMTNLARSFGYQGSNVVSQADKLIKTLEENALRDIRHYFPETWLFDTYVVGGRSCIKKGNDPSVCEVKVTAPHSITTWNVQAVGISKEHGMCVAEPAKIVVFRPFFIQVGLPYSAVRGEQIEVAATIFNYDEQKIEGVLVYMYGVEGICMGANAGETSEKRSVDIPGNGAVTVTFPLIPLKVAEYSLKIVALAGAMGSDAVEKKLRVIPEGVEKEVTLPIELDPSGQFRNRRRRNLLGEGITEEFNERLKEQTFTIEMDLPDNHIPGTGKCLVSVIGESMGPIIHTTMNGLEQKFIKLPTGCGEQTMIGLGPLVYTMLYLKRSNKMTAVAEKSGYQFMQKGYMWQLKYRQSDGSFSVWEKNHQSSTWLTAFVVRVFCQANAFIKIDKNVVCNAINWMARRQRADGAFYDAFRVYHTEMTGSVQGDVTLTAFVLIAVKECHQCDADIAKVIASKAVTYLERQLETQNGPFAVAITAYALLLAGSPKAEAAINKMKALSVFDEGTNTRTWLVDGSEFSGTKPWIYRTRPSGVAVETASYALLALVTYGDIEYAYPVVNWLNQQRSASGSFVSTQDTVVALQALAEYSAKANVPAVDMVCNVTSSQSTRAKRSFLVNNLNSLTLQEEELQTGGKLVVKAQGKGVAYMLATLRYNVEERPEESCKFKVEVKTYEDDKIKAALRPQPEFEGAVQMLGEDVVRSIVPDDSLYKLGYELDNEDVRSRAGDVNANDKKSRHVLHIETCVQYNGEKPTGMSIIEVGLFTGYAPEISDLRNLTSPLHKKITHVSSYEYTNRSVILYMDKIPNDEPLCLRFRAVEEMKVGKVQPTVVKVYDYYEPDQVCTVFYRPDNRSALMERICEGGECVCVEGQCPKCDPFTDLINIKDYKVQLRTLTDVACENYNFMWLVTLNRKYGENSFNYYEFLIKEVIKEGLEQRDDLKDTKVTFINRKTCDCPNMQEGQSYVIMANDGIQYRDKNNVLRYKYVFDKYSRVYQMKLLKQFPNKSPEQQFQKAMNSVIQNFVSRGKGCVT